MYDTLPGGKNFSTLFMVIVSDHQWIFECLGADDLTLSCRYLIVSDFVSDFVSVSASEIGQ